MEAAEDLDQPCSARVHHPALTQNGELLGRALDCRVARGDHAGERFVDRERLRLRVLGGLGHLADNREHRALDGPLDTLVGTCRRCAQRGCEDGRVDVLDARRSRRRGHGRSG